MSLILILNKMSVYTGKDTVVSDAYCAEVEKGGRAGQQQQADQQEKPGERPDRQTPQQPPLSHLATLSREQSQLDGRVAADPTRFSAAHEEDQRVEER